MQFCLALQSTLSYAQRSPAKSTPVEFLGRHPVVTFLVTPTS
jgi:hypothetical protein